MGVIEETAFVREAQEMLGGMYRLSMSILRRREDAQDAVQQAMLRAWERRAQAREATFRGWLTRIVINECRNIQRARMRVVPMDELPERPAPAQADDGALAVAMSCNTGANTSSHADIAIEAPTGSEVLSGSTRLKAGTATKIMLNMLSTASMVKLGKCYRNLMVDVRATNVKLRDRSIRITMNATGLDREAAAALYAEANGSIKTAIVMNVTGAKREQAEAALDACGGYVREAVKALSGGKE